MAFAVLSICTAGGLEMIRLDRYWKGGKENIHWQCIGKKLRRFVIFESSIGICLRHLTPSWTLLFQGKRPIVPQT